MNSCQADIEQLPVIFNREENIPHCIHKQWVRPYQSIDILSLHYCTAY